MMAADLPNDAKSDMREPTVLIIADDLDNLALVASYLEDFNFTILVAEDGESGLKIAAYTRKLLGHHKPQTDRGEKSAAGSHRRVFR